MGRAWQEPQAADAERAGAATEAAGDRAGQRPRRTRSGRPKATTSISSKKRSRAIWAAEGASKPQHRNNSDETGTSESFSKRNSRARCCGWKMREVRKTTGFVAVLRMRRGM